MDICCPGCRGSGAKCEVCDGVGYVCPTCLGEPRKLKVYRQDGTIYLRDCTTCGYDTSSGWQYDADRELQAVERYAADWVAGIATSRRITRQKEIEAIRAENEAQPRKRIWKAG